MARTATKRKPRTTEPVRSRRNAKAHTPPPFRPVQLAILVDAVPASTGWIHEMKYDGYRTLLAVGGGKARCYTRSGLDWSDRFPGIAA
jgi:bifunctional non-homologous end joining protein LigD